MRRILAVVALVLGAAALILGYEYVARSRQLKTSSREIADLQDTVSGYRSEIRNLNTALENERQAVENERQAVEDIKRSLLDLQKQFIEDREKARELAGKTTGVDAPVTGVAETTAAVEEQPEAIKVVPKRRLYHIGRQDVLAIKVWENPDLSQTVTVRPDGKISFPLIGEEQAEGLTVAQLEKRIEKKLATFVRSPDVSVSLTTVAGNRVTILGEVRSPGIVSVPEGDTLLQAIALAGGHTKDAVLRSVVVVKNVRTNPTAQRVNLDRVMTRGEMQYDILMDAEDFVYVPRKFIANLSRFLTQVLGPLRDAVNVRDDARDLLEIQER